MPWPRCVAGAQCVQGSLCQQRSWVRVLHHILIWGFEPAAAGIVSELVRHWACCQPLSFSLHLLKGDVEKKKKEEESPWILKDKINLLKKILITYFYCVCMGSNVCMHTTLKKIEIYVLAMLKHAWAVRMWWFFDLVHIGFHDLSWWGRLTSSLPLPEPKCLFVCHLPAGACEGQKSHLPPRWVVLGTAFLKDSLYSLSVLPWLAWNLLDRPGWFRTHQRPPTCVWLPSLGLKAGATILTLLLVTEPSC